MTVRRLLPVALALVVAAVAGIVVAGGDDDRYRVRLELDNAAGLREGSEVRLGGLQIGRVRDLRVAKGDLVVADLDVDPERLTLGAGATAEIRATNLLGEKFVYLDPGDRSKPRPSGVTIPRSRTSSSVDLDEVLDVLDTETRASLAVLINEAGFALTGRQADFNALLREVPPGVVAARRLVEGLARDNERLGALVRHAGSFVRRMSAERRDIGRLVDGAGTTLETVSSKRAELREALLRAPATLHSARGFLDELHATAAPLGPAARNIRATAGPLAAVVDQLEPFRRAARPAFRQAVETAPLLTRLATGATPVLRNAVPTLAELAALAQEAPPLTTALDASIDDTLGFVEGWARAIQGRDALGHVFRGRAIVGPEFFRALLQRLPAPADKRKRRAGAEALRREERPSAPAPTPPPARPGKPLVDPKPVLDTVDQVLGDVGNLVDELLKEPPLEGVQPPSSGSNSDSIDSLLDFLLG